MKKDSILIIIILMGMFINVLDLELPSATLSTNSSTGVIFRKFELNTIISETLAEVNMTGVFYNPTAENLTEAFTIKIPEGAYVSNVSLIMNGLSYWGRIMKRDLAEQAFQNATEANRTALLFSEIGDYTYEVEYLIEVETEIEICLSYYKRIARYKGHYNLDMDLEAILDQNPLVKTANYTILSPLRSITNVVAPPGAQIINHSSHEVSVSVSGFSSDFLSLSYDLEGNPIGFNLRAYSNGTNEFFFASFTPSTSEVGNLPKDFVFIIDTSGSMSGTKISQAKTALLNIIDQLYPEDRLGVVRFANSATAIKDTLVNMTNTADVDYIKNEVTSIDASGGTNIYDALFAGLDLFDSQDRIKIVVLLTDGQPTSGITNTAQIETDFRNANTDVSLFTLGFGNDVDFPFLERLATDNFGEAIKIEVGQDAAEAIIGFYDLVSTPLMRNIEISIASGVVNNEIYPQTIPNLYEGSEIFLTGERITGTTLDFRIFGEIETGYVNYNYTLSTPSSTAPEDAWIEIVWAIAKIDCLLDEIGGMAEGLEKNQTIDTVISIALFYGIVTPYTSIFIDTLHPESVTTETSAVPEFPPFIGFFLSVNTLIVIFIFFKRKIDRRSDT